MVFSTLLAIRHLHCGADSWNVGAGSDLPGDLRILGRAAAPGRRHHGSGLLLGLHEGQPAPPELHIEPPPTLLHRVPYSPGRRKDGFKNKTKYLFKSNSRKKEFPSSCPPSLLVKCFPNWTAMAETAIYLSVIMMMRVA